MISDENGIEPQNTMKENPIVDKPMGQNKTSGRPNTMHTTATGEGEAQQRDSTTPQSDSTTPQSDGAAQQPDGPASRGGKQPPETASEKTTPEPEDEGDNPRFDFGGLPNRNLKKNLGCG
jgi:hypothetical protein